MTYYYYYYYYLVLLLVQLIHFCRLNHDVGLIELANDVTYTDHIQPVCLPAYEDHFPYTDVEPRSTKKLNTTYTDCHIVGWGKTDYNSK